jgi:hypothetical protein
MHAQSDGEERVLEARSGCCSILFTLAPFPEQRALQCTGIVCSKSTRAVIQGQTRIKQRLQHDRSHLKGYLPQAVS